MATLYFSVVETVENEYKIDMTKEEVQRYMNGNREVKQSDVEQWMLEDKVKFSEQVEIISSNYSTLKII